MDLAELKQFLKIDGTALDVVLPVYQEAAEGYLANAGAAKDYTNALYKVAVTVIVALMVENPSLMVTGTISGETVGLALTGIIAQLRLSQGAS